MPVTRRSLDYRGFVVFQNCRTGKSYELRKVKKKRALNRQVVDIMKERTAIRISESWPAAQRGF
jgi:hypothetical protein